jgi:hypothetical protein
MPRIGATIGALATVVFCIGFNIFRYPKVWEMVAAMPDNDRASQGTLSDALPPAAISHAAPGTKPVPATKPAPAAPAVKIVGAEKPSGKRAAKVAAKYVAIALSSDNRSTAKTKPAIAKPKPVAAKASRSAETAKAHSASGKKTTQVASSQPAATVIKDSRRPPLETSRRPLVPVTRNVPGRTPADVAETRVAQAPLGGAGTSNQTCVIRRLPPVDPLEPRKLPPPSSSFGPIPFYPTTGIN